LFLLVGLGILLFSSGSFVAPAGAETPMPSPSQLPRRTFEPVTISTCVRGRTRIRRGPGTGYETIGGLISANCFTILGRNEEGSWVYIVSDDHQTGWVAASALDSDAGDISKVSVRDDTWLANLSRPTLTSAEIAYGAEVYLTQISATTIPQAPITQFVVPCFETASRVGEHISCRMEKAYCDYFPAVEGRPTLCSDRPHPDQSFALVVFGQDWSDYEGQCLIVSGYLEVNKGMLQIEALHRSQIAFCS